MLTREERVRLVALYYETGSATLARRRFLREGNRRFGPSRQAISQLLERFEASGSVTESASTGSIPGHPSAQPTRAFAKVRRAIARKPRLSVRRLASKIGISRSSAPRSLRKWLRLHPYPQDPLLNLATPQTHERSIQEAPLHVG